MESVRGAISVVQGRGREAMRPMFMFIIALVACFFVAAMVLKDDSLLEASAGVAPVSRAEISKRVNVMTADRLDANALRKSKRNFRPLKSLTGSKRTCKKAGRNGALQCFADILFIGVSGCGTNSMA